MPPLRRGESFATGMVRPRTTALFFDKLWVHPALISDGSRDLDRYGLSVPSELCVNDPLGSRLYYWGYAANAGVLGWFKKQPNWANYLVADLKTADPYFELLDKSFVWDSLEDFSYREDHD